MHDFFIQDPICVVTELTNALIGTYLSGNEHSVTGKVDKPSLCYFVLPETTKVIIIQHTPAQHQIISCGYKIDVCPV